MSASATAAPCLRGKMRVWQVGDLTGALTLRMVEEPIPIPTRGEVLLKMKATALNARDLLIIRGRFGKTPKPTHVPLTDCAADVIALGDGVTDLAVGDRVTLTNYALWRDGRWHNSLARYDIGNNVDGVLREYAALPAAFLVKLPPSLTDAEACTLSIAGLTAWRALVTEARLQSGETVLTLGTGGVSVYGLQLAKAMGARVIVTSSSDDKLAHMKALGANATVNYRTTPAWEQNVLALTGGEGADVILNNVGYPAMEQCLRAAASEARLIHIGASREPVAMKGVAGMIMKSVMIKGIANGSRQMLADLVAAMTATRIKPVIARVFPFDQALEAARFMEGTDRVGKVVIKIA